MNLKAYESNGLECVSVNYTLVSAEENQEDMITLARFIINPLNLYF